MQSPSSAADNQSANEASPCFHWTHRIIDVVTKVRQRALPAINIFQSRPWNLQISQIVQTHIYISFLFRPIPILSSHPSTGFRPPPPSQPIGLSTRVGMHFTYTPMHAPCTDYLILSDSCYCLYYWGFHSCPCSRDGPLFKESYLGVPQNSVLKAKCPVIPNKP
jgi:hypothetical protein